MQSIFLDMVKLSLIGSLFAAAVMLVRLIFRKAPKWLFCILWGIVALRLICPVSIKSDVSLVPDNLATGQIITNVGNEYFGDVDIIYESNADYSNAIEAGRQPVHSNDGYYVVTEKDSLEEPKTVAETVYPILCWVWVGGMALMIAYTAVSFFVLRKKMEEATHLQDNVWQCEQADSPFVLGFIKPRIYLPYTITDSDMANVIAHEQAHIQRKDHWWKPIGFLLLSIHWFNPVLWLAYILLCRDIEAACDEKVIKHMDKDEMRAYSTALLHCSVHRRRIAACPLAFGEVGVKERIKRVMNYKKPAFWIVMAAILAGVVVAVCFLTAPKPSPEFAMSGNNIRDLDVDIIIDRISSIEGLEDTNAYTNSNNFYHIVDSNFDWVDSQTVRYFYNEGKNTRSAQLQIHPNENEYHLTESVNWRNQEHTFLLQNYLDAIKYLPQEAIKRIAPADRYIIRQIEEGMPDQYSRVITYTPNGVKDTNGWLIHLQVEPLQAAEEGYVGTGDEVIQLFYTNVEGEITHDHTPVEKRQADSFIVHAEEYAECTEYSISYEEPDGCITTVAEMGHYEQPFMIHNDLIYFVGSGKICAIDFSGNVQKECAFDAYGGSIVYSDENYLYGAADVMSSNANYIFQVDWDLTECIQIDAFPKQFRQFDYKKVSKDFAELCQADISKIYVHGANVFFDANGMAYQMFLKVTAVNDSATISGNLLLGWQNQHPSYDTVSMNPWFNKVDEGYGSTEGLMTLEDFLAHLKIIEDTSVVPDNLPSGTKPFRLTYRSGTPEELPIAKDATNTNIVLVNGTPKLIESPLSSKEYFSIVSKDEDEIIGTLYILVD